MVKPPITVSYGSNLCIHPSVFINQNCLIGDTPLCPITIGAHTLIGPFVRIYGVTHPLDWRQRRGREGPSLAGAVRIGENVWIGDGVIVM